MPPPPPQPPPKDASADVGAASSQAHSRSASSTTIASSSSSDSDDAAAADQTAPLLHGYVDTPANDQSDARFAVAAGGSGGLDASSSSATRSATPHSASTTSRRALLHDLKPVRTHSRLLPLLLVWLLTVATLTTLLCVLLLVLVPRLIQDGFAGRLGNPPNARVNVTRAQVLSVDDGLPAGVAATGYAAAATAGDLGLALAADVTGLPSVLVDVVFRAPSTWYVDVVDRVDSGNRSTLFAAQVPADIALRRGAIALAEDPAYLNVLATTGATASGGQRFPVGAGFVRALLVCVTTGNASAVPLLSVRTEGMVSLGGVINYGRLPLARDVDVGQILVDNNLTLVHPPPVTTTTTTKATATATATASATATATPTLGKPTLSYLTSPPSLLIPLTVPLVGVGQPYTLTVRNATARISLGGVAVALVTFPEVSLVSGSQSFSTTVNLTAAWSVPNPSGSAVGSGLGLLTTPAAVVPLLTTVVAGGDPGRVRFDRVGAVVVGTTGEAAGVAQGSRWLDEVLAAVDVEIGWDWVVYLTGGGVPELLKKLVTGA
ncbi:hypothetical protein DFJ73DRAFT_755843 [Zopfochytrium polystomum]|nr:hypothetical protein DFJ73DRAFT_755843 [Zopfochytrium polystomum]